MNSASQQNSQATPQQETWPHKLNKALIGIGVIAFGLIVTDRVIEMFSADDAPAVQVEVERTQQIESAAGVMTDTDVANNDKNEQAAEIIVAAESSQNSLLETELEPVVLTIAAPKPDLPAGTVSSAEQSSVDLLEIFGSRVVFVSASEPVYVVTEDDRRFDVGSEINAQTTLAGVTAQQLILDQAGDLTVISLPDPVVQ
ncbi:MAG: hypothetical protein AB8B79_00745 [Granulosicoccus sp.]